MRSILFALALWSNSSPPLHLIQCLLSLITHMSAFDMYDISTDVTQKLFAVNFAIRVKKCRNICNKMLHFSRLVILIDVGFA